LILNLTFVSLLTHCGIG